MWCDLIATAIETLHFVQLHFQMSVWLWCRLGGQSETKTDSCGSMMTTTKHCFISCAIQTPAELCIKKKKLRLNLTYSKCEQQQERRKRQNITEMNLLSNQLIAFSSSSVRVRTQQ